MYDMSHFVESIANACLFSMMDGGDVGRRARVGTVQVFALLEHCLVVSYAKWLNRKELAYTQPIEGFTPRPYGCLGGRS